MRNFDGHFFGLENPTLAKSDKKSPKCTWGGDVTGKGKYFRAHIQPYQTMLEKNLGLFS